MKSEPAYSPVNVGRRIKVIRLANNLSQAKLAKKLGIVASTVGNWEQGRSRPNEDQVNAMCDLFSVTSDYIIFGKTFGLMHGVASSLALAERRLSKT